MTGSSSSIDCSIQLDQSHNFSQQIGRMNLKPGTIFGVHPLKWTESANSLKQPRQMRQFHIQWGFLRRGAKWQVSEEFADISSVLRVSQ